MVDETFKQDFLNELIFLERMGNKLFICPFNNRTLTKLLGYYITTLLIVFTAVQLFLTLFITGFGDFLEIINIAPNIGVCVISCIKYTTINKNQDFYDKIFQHFREDLWELIPNHSIENITVFTRYTDISKWINKFLVLIVVVLVIVVDSFPWLIMTLETRFLGKDPEYLSPFEAWYPFDKVKWYSVAYIWESLMTAVVICVYAFVNMIHLTIVTFMCMEINILGNWLQELINDVDIENIRKRRNLVKTHNKIKKKLKYIIKRYNFLSEISSRLDKVLSDIMLLTYVFDAVFICLTAFSFTVTDDLYKSLRYFSFFFSLVIEMFDQCIIGQVLIDHSEALSAKIYCSNWIYADAETKKILLMLIRRTQRPFKLTANNFFVMDLNTFTRICSSSYQLFNLLRTVYLP